MTEKQTKIVKALREEMMRTGYQDIYIVNNETLEAVERHLEEWLESLGRPPILQCGKNGLLFKGCELVLEVKNDRKTRS